MTGTDTSSNDSDTTATPDRTASGTTTDTIPARGGGAADPVWARTGLLAVTVLAAVLYSWNLAENRLPVYYSVAVRSMSVSWHAFFYGALDPDSTVTLDKLPGAFVPEALAARLLGYHGWSLALPSVVAGIVTVLVTYRIGRRLHGPATGLLAAGLFTTTPIVASMFGHPMEDGLLTMCLVLAADAFLVALADGRLGPLVRCGVWVGIGFQVKMLQAWMVLPAMVVAYLLAAPGPVGRRIGRLAAAGAVMLAVSVSWLVLSTVTPAGNRPFVDGTTNNNAFTMAFGYNGVSHLGIDLPGTGASPFLAATQRAPGAGDPTPREVGKVLGGPGGDQAWTKLLEPGYGSQVGWLYPLSAVGLVLGPLTRRGRPRVDPERGTFVFWGVWLATFAVVFSVILTPHTAYVAALAPAVAVLSAAGVVLAWRAYLDGGRAWGVLPLAIAAEGVWTLHLASRYAGFLPWLTWAVAAAAVLSVAVLVATGRGGASRSGLALPAALAGTVAMVAVPVAWSLSVLDPKYAGTEFDATAGPVQRMVDISRLGSVGGRAGFLTSVEDVADLPAPQRDIARYLLAHRGGARYLAATDGWVTGGPFITATGLPFLPVGGFGGVTPSVPTARVQQLVATGRLRYVLLSPFSPPRNEPVGRFAGVEGLVPVARWVRSACTDVTATAGPAAAAQPPPIRLTVYDCAP